MNRADKILDQYRAIFDGRIIPIDRTMLYSSIIELIGAEQFTWRGLPEPMNSHYTERAINTGYAVAYEIPDNISMTCKGFAITPAAFIGEPNQIGETNTVITKGTDYSLTIDLTKDKAVLIKNNDYFYSEYPNLLWFADMLARTDASEKALIIWSKVHPIAKATSGIDGEKLKEVIKAIINDDESFFDIINDDTKVVTGQPSSRDDSVLRLSDENAVEKMHFLSEFHYELIRRYCTLYNIPFRTTSKSAQNLESELHNTDIFSKIINENRLKCRKDAAAKISEMFGINCTVDFSDVIKMENDVITANVEQEKADAENAENVSRETTEITNESEVKDDESNGN